MTPPSDEALVRAFQQGDDAAFATFAKRHADDLFRLARLWLREPEHAADVVQEIFLRSYTGLHRFAFRAAPKTWLFRMCRNVTAEFNRRSARWITLADPEAMLDAQQADGPSEEEESGLPPLLDFARLRELLSQLPERQRQTVTLRVLEELSVAQTAAVMGCRPGTVKAHLNKGLTALRRLVAESDRDAP